MDECQQHKLGLFQFLKPLQMHFSILLVQNKIRL